MDQRIVGSLDSRVVAASGKWRFGDRDGNTMWMSNLYIMVSCNNSDRNNLGDLCAAVREAGATVVAVDEQNQLIEAAAPSHEVATIAAMEGVKYVRCLFSYFVDLTRRTAA